MNMHFLFLECCGIVKKIRENSISPVMDIKASPIPEERESKFRPTEKRNCWPKNQIQDFYTLNSKGEESKRHLDASAFQAPLSIAVAS